MGLFDIFRKKQPEKRGEEIAQIVHDKKNKYTGDMLRLQRQTRKIHENNLKALEESKKLNIMVNDIASQIARATPGGRKLKLI